VRRPEWGGFLGGAGRRSSPLWALTLFAARIYRHQFAATECKIPAMTDLAHYRLLEAALPNEEKRIRSSYMPSLVLIVALSTVVFVALGISKGATSRSMIQYGLIMVVYMAYLAVWYPRRMRRRLIRCWETYDLEIGHDYLLRRQADIPDLRLQFDEVQAVEHVQGRYLRVIGKTKSRAISIPESIDHFDQVLETVSSLRPVQVRTIEQWQKYRVFMAAGLLLFIIMLWATSPVVVIPLSLAMGSVIVWACFWIRRNPNIPGSSKRIAWIYWLFFVVCALKLFVAVSSYRLQQTAILGTAPFLSVRASFCRMGGMVAPAPSSVLAKLCDRDGLGHLVDFSLVPVWCPAFRAACAYQPLE